MHHQQAKTYLLSKPASIEDFPFGPEVSVFKVKGKMFAERLVQDAGIVRHRGKINATINNAKCALEVIQEFGSLAHYFWQFEPKRNESAAAEFMATCEESIALSKDLKKRGWKFVGPTTMYAFMQAMGMVNDHAQECEMHNKAKELRAELTRP